MQARFFFDRRHQGAGREATSLNFVAKAGQGVILKLWEEKEKWENKQPVRSGC